MKTTLRMILAVVLMLVITLSGILIVDHLAGGARIDLTENNIYSLSDGTDEILSRVNQPVTLKLYYSRKTAVEGPEQLREYSNYFRYVRSMLENYVQQSGGMLKLQVIDPRPFSDAEQNAIDYGLKRVPLGSNETFFFGLVAETELGKQATIPFFRMERRRFLEYDLTKLLSEVISSKKKTVGVLSSLQVMGSQMNPRMAQMMGQRGQQEPWQVVKELRKRYEVKKIQKSTAKIDQDLDMLMVVHPKKLPKKTLYAIDQYVMRGGKLAVFVDPFCMADPAANPRSMMQRRRRQQGQPSSTLNQLLSKWGVKMKKNAVAADRALAVTAQVSRDSRPKPVVTYLNLTDECTNDSEVVTGQLASVNMLFAGALEKTGSGDGDNITTLLHTTGSGDTWSPSRPGMMRMLAMQPQNISQSIGDDARQIALGYRLAGTFETNFPDGPPEISSDEEASGGQGSGGQSPMQNQGGGQQGKSAEEQKAAQPELVEQSKPGAQVFVYSDVDMLSDRLAYQQSFLGSSAVGDNSSLVLNSVDYLAGSRALINVRSKGREQRPFEVIKDIEARTEEEVAARVKKLNQKIQKQQKKLQNLASKGGEGSAELVGSKIMERRRKIQDDIREARKKLRELNAGKRREIEELKSSVQFHTMVWAPAAVLLIAIGLTVTRYVKARRYAGRRTSR